MNTGSYVIQEIATSKRFFFLLSVVLVSFLLVTCFACGLSYGDIQIKQESFQSTAEAEALLTKAYGTEVSSVIEDFESQLYRGETEDRSISATVKSVRVLEYDSRRFKAVADVIRETAVSTATREFITGSEKSTRICRIYVFVCEDDKWKLAGSFTLTPNPDDVARAWNAQPNWLKEVIGELPDEIDPCDWY